MAFGADPAHPGRYFVYANTLVFNDGSGPGGNATHSGMAVNVSKDGGTTWSKAVILEQDSLAGLNDKNWIVADNGTGPGHTTGRVYVMWDRVQPMVYTYCDKKCDKAANWASVANMTFYPFSPTQGIGAIPLVLPDGSVGVVFEGLGGTPPITPPTDQSVFAAGNTQLQYAVSKGAGSTPWPAPLPFLQASFGIAANENRAVREQRAGTLPAAAADPRTGRLYVDWEDGRFRSDGLNDIVFSTSTNGIVWTTPKRINPGPENNHVDRWNATIDVDVHGVVHVSYRQRDEHPGTATPRSATGLSPYIDTYYQESRDHGATWSTPLLVNSVRSDVGFAAYSRGGAFLGDYNQIAAASNDTSYVVRDESIPRYAGEKCNCSFTRGNGHQHQFTYVAVIGTGSTSGSPSSSGGKAARPETHSLRRVCLPLCRGSRPHSCSSAERGGSDAAEGAELRVRRHTEPGMCAVASSTKVATSMGLETAAPAPGGPGQRAPDDLAAAEDRPGSPAGRERLDQREAAADLVVRRRLPAMRQVAVPVEHLDVQLVAALGEPHPRVVRARGIRRGG